MSRDKPYAGVICRGGHGEGLPACGKVGLTQREYDRQMDRPDRGWHCPRCGGLADFDDERFEELQGITGPVSVTFNRCPDDGSLVSEQGHRLAYGGVPGCWRVKPEDFPPAVGEDALDALAFQRKAAPLVYDIVRARTTDEEVAACKALAKLYNDDLSELLARNAGGDRG